MMATHDAVVIPGFGGFITKYKSARIDAAAGHIHPPAKYVAFNEQLDIHDNTFARYLDEETSAHYSPRLFDLFVAQLKADLSSNQVIVIPKIGRIYQDYEGQTHFMPDLQNLNNDAFGLPKLNVSKGDWANRTIVQSTKSLKSESLRTALSSAATVILLFSLVWVGTSFLGSEFNDGLMEMSIIDAVTADDAPDSTLEKEKKAEKAIIPEIEEKATPTPEAVEPIIAKESAIVIVGAFGSLSNADKMVRQIKELGMESYRDQPSQLHRVGVSINYSSEEELESMLSSIQKSITSKAWILK